MRCQCSRLWNDDQLVAVGPRLFSCFPMTTTEKEKGTRRGTVDSIRFVFMALMQKCNCTAAAVEDHIDLWITHPYSTHSSQSGLSYHPLSPPTHTFDINLTVNKIVEYIKILNRRRVLVMGRRPHAHHHHHYHCPRGLHLRHQQSKRTAAAWTIFF